MPNAGATGVSSGRSRVESDDAGDRPLMHAAPHTLEVLRSAEDGRLLAHSEDRNRGDPGPMSYLVRDGNRMTLEDGWSTDDDLGRLVRLPVAKAGTLRA